MEFDDQAQEALLPPHADDPLGLRISVREGSQHSQGPAFLTNIREKQYE